MAGGADLAKEARAILAKWKIDINSPVNGVWLPKSMHRGGHASVYYKEVTKRIVAADGRGGKQAVYEELRSLKAELLSGELRVHF